MKFFLEPVSNIQLSFYRVFFCESRTLINTWNNSTMFYKKTVIQALFAIGFSKEHFRESLEFRDLFSQKTKHEFLRKPYLEQGIGVTQVVLLMTSRGIRCV